MEFGPTDRMPPGFDAKFLAWFRHATERHWAHARPRTLREHAAAGVGGLDFVRGTQWVVLDGAGVERAEESWGSRFPPDYRLFLQHLHSTSPPMRGALFGGAGGILTPATRPGFYNWVTDGAAMAEALEAVLDGLAFEVENQVLWPDSWGARPDTPDSRRLRLGELLAGAPRLIPIFGHRFLLGEPCRAGNPVLSIHQSDIIVHGGRLREYLLTECGLPVGAPASSIETGSIPFWGELTS
ncbi:MAG: hypothetical protein HYZ53_02335 [Planctomycetes bacterium]|nr:hypothetical protein [Planctomycetota bacterium]